MRRLLNSADEPNGFVLTLVNVAASVALALVLLILSRRWRQRLEYVVEKRLLEDGTGNCPSNC